MKKENQSFEDAIKELEKVVEGLESGDLSLDEAIEKFQKGIELSKFCNKRLDEAEKKISVLVEDENGGLKEKPFMTEEA
jgi:exodeoxyribonuclease VII small subunit